MASLTAQAEIVVENTGGNLHVNQVVNSGLLLRDRYGGAGKKAMDSGMGAGRVFLTSTLMARYSSV
jgi:hypothetical protein